MIFRPELAELVLRGEKTVTRRLVSDNPRSPWWRERCALRPGQTVAVCPGRGKPAIGRVRIVRVTREPLGAITDAEAAKEGFASADEFRKAFTAINGGYAPDALVWRIEFVRVIRTPEPQTSIFDLEMVA